jgi:hypothetical protein
MGTNELLTKYESKLPVRGIIQRGPKHGSVEARLVFAVEECENHDLDSGVTCSTRKLK